MVQAVFGRGSHVASCVDCEMGSSERSGGRYQRQSCNQKYLQQREQRLHLTSAIVGIDIDEQVHYGRDSSLDPNVNGRPISNETSCSCYLERSDDRASTETMLGYTASARC